MVTTLVEMQGFQRSGDRSGSYNFSCVNVVHTTKVVTALRSKSSDKRGSKSVTFDFRTLVRNLLVWRCAAIRITIPLSACVALAPAWRLPQLGNQAPSFFGLALPVVCFGAQQGQLCSRVRQLRLT